MSMSLKSSLLVAIAVTGLTSLSACAPYMDSIQPYDERYKTSVAETFERLELYVRPQGMNLTARDRGAMQQFINLYGSQGDGAMYLNVPSNAAGAPGIRQAQSEIQNLLMQAGLAGAPIQTGQYNAAQGATAPVVLSFRRLATVHLECGVTDNLLKTYNNQTYDNFGCADRANFALMVGDPQQLLEPYVYTAPDNTRRVTGYDKWKEGESPASTVPENQAVSVTE